MKSVSPEELKKHLSEDSSLTVIDVRECWEHEEKNIGATNIPLAELPEKLGELEHLKLEMVVVHCQSGKRSSQAQKFLTMNGFSNVVSLKGGLEAYINAT